jgi:DNA-binding MarR family transcriptional regulator
MLNCQQVFIIKEENMDRFERFAVAVTEISYHVHRLMSQAMEQYGLRGINAIYLTVLNRVEGGITASKLGEYCCRDKADVSRAVAILEQKGLVRKEAGRYRAKLHLTEQGKQLAQHVRDIAQRAVAAAGSGISDEDRAVLYGSLESIAGKLQELSIESLPEGNDEREIR